MKWFDTFIRYRFWISLVVLAVAVLVNVLSGFWPAFILYLAAVIMLFTHFFFGPLRLIQADLEAGDFEKAEKVLDLVWFPNLLYKPVRSVYYTPEREHRDDAAGLRFR